MNEFFRRLKQRKLVQWTLAYVAAAFALLQGIDIVAQRFGWPEQTMRFVIIALSVGLFVTLVLAWYHGERGAQRVTGTELLILALLLAIGGGLLWRFVSIARGPTEQSGAARASAESKSEINAKSVAVLAFANLSDDKGSEYFSDGISEELLTVLQKIPGLHVAARTSAFSFKGKNATAQEIGAETRRGASGRGKCAQGRRRRAHRGPTHSGQHGRRAMVGKLHAQFEGCVRGPDRTRPDDRRTVARSAHRWRGES